MTPGALMLARGLALAGGLSVASTAFADGGALVARGTLANGEPAAVFVGPVPPRAGTVTVEAVAESWREAPPRISLELDGVEVGGTATRSPIDPLAASIELTLPTAGNWRLVVESGAGRLEATVPVAGAPPPWRHRLPWMLAWVPAAALLWMRSRLAPRPG